MEDGNSESNGGGKSASGRSKTPNISTSTRLQRNQAEKERRDKLNGFISELATLVPMVSNASKPLDKVSILRLAAAEMRLHFSCLNPKRYKSKPLALPPAIMGSLDLIEKTIGGFIIVTTLTGLIVFCSRSIEEYLGYQNIDVMGNKVMKYIYEDDVKYFEAKVSSVVSSLKKGPKKKSKVIKVHMLQKPLPRSNETSRPRSMIFKMSVHQNDTNGTNGIGSSNQSTSIAKKTRTGKDFGYSAVVLMFIEPVRLEPEIDITYIDSNQDVYFTRHGLNGEIIYSDQRISTITGYMPHDVQGTSAYQYICSSDVPIALFAQKAMFTSNDGKGDIVYRLRIRDLRFIYLQSSGQIAYKESTSEVSHFVCFNRLLSEEEGSQELKKFQQRYAPQIMAEKMLQVKRNSSDSHQSQNPDLSLEHSPPLTDSPVLNILSSPVASISSFRCSKVSSPDVGSGVSEQILSGDSFASPSSSSIAANSVHSSEGHSMTSPLSYDRSSSIVSEYSGYKEEPMDFVEKTDHRSPLNIDCNSFVAAAYDSAITSVAKEESLGEVNFVNGLDGLLVIAKSPHSENNTASVDGSYRIQQQNGLCASANHPIMHPVNAFNGSSQSSIAMNGTPEATSIAHPMGLSFDHAVLPQNSPFVCTDDSSVYHDDKSNGLMPLTNGHQNEYNGQAAREDRQFVTEQSNLDLPRSLTQNTLRDQHVKFNGGQVLQSVPSHPLGLSSLYEFAPIPSLSKHSNHQLPVVADLGDAADYCPGVNSYHENVNGYLPAGVGGYNHGANDTAYGSNLDVLNQKMFFGVNGFRVPATSVDVPTRFPAMDSLDSATDTPIEMAAADLPPVKRVAGDFLGTVDAKPPIAEYQNGSSDAFSNARGPDVAATWTGSRADSVASADLALNRELYEELDLFFQNFPQSDIPLNQGVAEPVPEFPVVASSSYHQNSISSSSTRAKRNYHQ